MAGGCRDGLRPALSLQGGRMGVIAVFNRPGPRDEVSRAEIRKGFQDALNLVLHDYTVRRIDSRSYGDLVFNVGEWQAKVGDQPLRGYYTSVLGREDDQIKVFEETVTVTL